MPSPSYGVDQWWAWEAQTCLCARGHEPSTFRENPLAAERAASLARAKDPGTVNDRLRVDPVKMCMQVRRSHVLRQRVRVHGPETWRAARDVASLAEPVSPEPTSPVLESHQVGGASFHNSHCHLRRKKEGNRERLYFQQPFSPWIAGEMFKHITKFCSLLLQ